MTATTEPTWTVNTDAWSLARMREAAAFRAENPGVTADEKATDAYLDAYLAACEAAAAEVGVTVERPVTDEPTPARGTGSGASNYGGSRNAPSDAQLRFIASLSRDLGYDLQTPRDKSHASLIINGAKKALEELRKAGKAPAGRPARPATQGQQEYVADLLLNRTHEHPSDLDVTALTFEQASALITELREAPRAKVAAHGIREGYYAFSTDGGQTADHYRVTRNGTIRVWSAGGEHPYRGKLNAGLEWIKDNQRDAAALFGRLIGTCGRCGRLLSDDDSRARGLGPVCASKGW